MNNSIQLHDVVALTKDLPQHKLSRFKLERLLKYLPQMYLRLNLAMMKGKLMQCQLYVQTS